MRLQVREPGYLFWQLHRDYPTPEDAYAYANEVLNETDPFPDPGETSMGILLHTETEFGETDEAILIQPELSSTPKLRNRQARNKAKRRAFVNLPLSPSKFAQAIKEVNS